jgi:hypothetical protein
VRHECLVFWRQPPPAKTSLAMGWRRHNAPRDHKPVISAYVDEPIFETPSYVARSEERATVGFAELLVVILVGSPIRAALPIAAARDSNRMAPVLILVFVVNYL